MWATRLGMLVSALSARPERSVPQACETWAASTAASRFWSHLQVTPHAIQTGQAARTMQRLEQEAGLILAIQDTRALVSNTHPATTGLVLLPGATTEGTAPQGMLVPSVVAVIDQGVPLGRLHQHVWVRPPEDVVAADRTNEQRKALQKARRRQEEQRPIEDRERSRWLRSVHAVERQMACQRVLVVGDREADIDEWFAQPRRTGVDLPVKITSCVPRSARCVQAGNGRRARTAQVQIRLRRQRLLAPDHSPPSTRAETRPLAVRLRVLLVEEPDPPAGQEALCWLVLTPVPIVTQAQARQCLQWDTWRWLIERSGTSGQS